MADQKNTIQLVWGVLLVLAGIGVFFRVPQVMPRIEQIGYFTSATVFIRFCFYLIGILLIGGGGRKIFTFIKAAGDDNTET